ncbi:MAG: hypothetical protein M3312_05705 [Actinomycetota bacterium]|nr:hypothetical protein [Actinomycetota bacterium]
MTASALIPGCRRLAICSFVALALALALAHGAGAQAQGRGNDGVSRLWKTFPLDPHRGKARIQRGKEGQTNPAPPATSTAPRAPGGSDVRNAEQQPSEGRGGASGRPEPLTLVVLAFLGLVLVALVVVPVARMGAAVPDSLARAGSVVVSPARALASVPRRKRLLASRRAARRRARAGEQGTTAPPRSRSSSLPSLSGPIARAGSSALAGARALAALPPALLAAVAGLAVVISRALRLVLSRRYQIALYAFVALGSASLGVAIALLLSGV